MKEYLNHPLFRWPLLIAKSKATLGLLALIIIVGGAYMLGWRIGPGLQIVQVGTLELVDVPAGASIFVDKSWSATSKGKTIDLQLLPGSHTVIVGTEDGKEFPWNELVTIKTNATTVIRPLLIPKSSPETNLRDLDRDRGELLMKDVRLPTIEKPLVIASGCIFVSVENKRIIANMSTDPSCTPLPYLCTEGTCEPTVVLAPLEEPRAVLPYVGRDDMILVVLSRGIYVVEVDAREPQFFAPLLGGKNLDVAVWSEDSIVVRDTGAVFTIKLP